MSLIYVPNGKAREYSPLALNIYNGCDHGCTYCYVQGIKRSKTCCQIVQERKDLLSLLHKELKQSKPQKQILLSFMCDPYSNYDETAGVTREVLKELNAVGCLVALLTKGGKRCLRDLDIFKSFGSRFKIGATLTLLNEMQSKEIEPGAALPVERIETLKILHEAGIKTFVSMEPVIDPAQSLELMLLTLPFVDQYKIGKLNHYENRFAKIDWKIFFEKSVELMRSANKQFYVKADLRVFDTDKILNPHECDYDFMALKFENQDNTSSRVAA
jgi:DNA repair photolyase